jgi:hypothetical protein
MDPIIAKFFAEGPTGRFTRTITKLGQDYVTLGEQALNYIMPEFDIAHDLLNAWEQVEREDFDLKDRFSPNRFILPMTATHLWTMATWISQALFGEASPHQVEGRGPEDEESAELMNQLLRWNAEQQPTYFLGFQWVLDSLTYNRGVMFDEWRPQYKVQIEVVDAVNPFEMDEEGNPKVYQKPQKVRKAVGGYNYIELVSPYNFLLDPMLPIWRFQDGRFAGHRTLISWTELNRRSQLDVESPEYVDAATVERIKKAQDSANAGAPLGQLTTNPMATSTSHYRSRSYIERNRTNSPTGITRADKHDGGIVEVHVLWIRIVPSDYGISDSDIPTVYQLMLANRKDVLSLNEVTYEHDMFPYSIGEARSSGHYQSNQSWALMLKPMQDYIDYLKDRRHEALARTVGNIFIAKTDKVDLDDFLDPKKEGKIIAVHPDANSERLDDIIRQVPINDMTKGLYQDMEMFINFSETVTAANSQMQGNAGDETNSATAFAGNQQMASGRLMSIARMLSVIGLVPQTRRFVKNFQQFLDDELVIKLKGDHLNFPSTMREDRFATLSRDTIQGDFDYIAHDGTIPGADSKAVAAATRLVEAAMIAPQIFEPAPGNLDLRSILLETAKKAGLNVERFVYRNGDVRNGVTIQRNPTNTPPPQSPQGSGAIAQRAQRANPVSLLEKPATRVDGQSGGLKLPAVDLQDAGTPGIRPSNA